MNMETLRIRRLLLAVSVTCHFVCCVQSKTQRYEPNWQSLETRPLPSWYDEAKIGIFIHWGVFSVPSFAGAWFWYWWEGPTPRSDVVEFIKKNYPPNFTYAAFAPELTTEFFNPDEWADILKSSGAKYVVLTTKHHEGFCLWPSNYSWNWNAMEVGPKRDIVGDLATAVRKRELKFGTYHSLFEFFNPLFLRDHENNFTTQDYVKMKTMPELYELVNTYKPDIVWSDGQAMALDSYWNSTNFLAWLYNDSPVKDTVVTNDRWGSNTICKHGGYLTCHDKFNPKVKQDRKFEDSTSLDTHSWAYRRNMKLGEIYTIEEIITLIAQVVSCGGNILLNVAPTKDGTIIPVFEERLRQMGQWLEVNGEGIYTTKPWTYQNDSNNGNVWYTSKKLDNATIVYAIVLEWPKEPNLILADPIPSVNTVVTLLGYPDVFQWRTVNSEVLINIPSIPINKMPCKWAWVFKLTYIAN